MIVKAGLTLASSLLGMIGAKGERAKESLENARDSMERSWTDEVLVVYWFGPTIVAMFGYTSSLEAQTAAIAEFSPLFQVQIAITAAIFGLGKLKLK
jgi:hypothetical protein